MNASLIRRNAMLLWARRLSAAVACNDANEQESEVACDPAGD